MTDVPEHLCRPRGSDAGDTYLCPCGRELTFYITEYGSTYWASEDSKAAIEAAIMEVESRAKSGYFEIAESE